MTTFKRIWWMLTTSEGLDAFNHFITKVKAFIVLIMILLICVWGLSWL